MEIYQFESFVSDTILERGYDYFKRGFVNNIVEIDHGHVQARVSGTDDYVVNVSMDGQTVLRTSCTCPFDLAQCCKHQVAVFYALREGNQEDREDLTQLLASLDKETLIEIILQNTEEHPELERTLFLKYGSGKHDTNDAKQLIQNYFEEASTRGFIDWRNMHDAMRGTELVLEQASSLLEDEDPQRTIALSLTVLAETVEVISYSDDSGGEVGIVIDEALELIGDAVNHHIIKQNQSIQEEVFHELIQEATHPRYEEWDEWGIALLDICTKLSDLPHLSKQLLDHIDAWLKSLGEEGWRHDYTKEKLLLIKLDLIEQYDTDQYFIFLKEHLHHSAFREKLIEHCYQDGNYDEVVRLCLEAEEKDRDLPGLVKQWKVYRYQAYEYAGATEYQKELGEELLLDGDFQYFHKLKSLYSTNEWGTVLHRILNKLEHTHHSSTYVNILIEEDIKGKLLNYCEKNLSSITRLYPHLIDVYPEKVAQLFSNLIYNMAEEARDRKRYREVCRIIQQFEQVSNKTEALHMITILEQEHKRRPAFLDELSKIK